MPPDDFEGNLTVISLVTQIHLSGRWCSDADEDKNAEILCKHFYASEEKPFLTPRDIRKTRSQLDSHAEDPEVRQITNAVKGRMDEWWEAMPAHEQAELRDVWSGGSPVEETYDTKSWEDRRNEFFAKKGAESDTCAARGQ